ncbi:MAG: hypothetical protein LRZ88_07295 [Candidatus Cloacimonetes bacterium]|nr:hypothetical protein [Candidatus Cloacimonadota bacterium]
MNKLFTITVIILTLTGSLRALEGSPFFRQPAFDPFPKSSGTNTRQNLPSADITQSYLTTSQTWENSWKNDCGTQRAESVNQRHGLGLE